MIYVIDSGSVAELGDWESLSRRPSQPEVRSSGCRMRSPEQDRYLGPVYLGSDQPPTGAVSLSASAGPQLPGLYGITLESSRIGSTMRQASST